MYAREQFRGLNPALKICVLLLCEKRTFWFIHKVFIGTFEEPSNCSTQGMLDTVEYGLKIILKRNGHGYTLTVNNNSGDQI